MAGDHGRRANGEVQLDAVHHGVKLVDHDELVLLRVLEPLVEPLRRAALVPALVLVDGLLERLALSRDLGVPLAPGTLHEVVDRVRLVLDVGRGLGLGAGSRLGAVGRVEQVAEALAEPQAVERAALDARLARHAVALVAPGKEEAQPALVALDLDRRQLERVLRVGGGGVVLAAHDVAPEPACGHEARRTSTAARVGDEEHDAARGEDEDDDGERLAPAAAQAEEGGRPGGCEAGEAWWADRDASGRGAAESWRAGEEGRAAKGGRRGRGR